MSVIELFWQTYRKMGTQSYGSKDIISMIARLPFIEFSRMSTGQIAWFFYCNENIQDNRSIMIKVVFL